LEIDSEKVKTNRYSIKEENNTIDSALESGPTVGLRCYPTRPSLERDRVDQPIPYRPKK